MEQKITIPEGYELKKVNDSEYRIIKKKVELPNSWEEFCKTHQLKSKESYVDSISQIVSVNIRHGRERTESWFNLLPNKAYAESILALCQLIQLRDCYRQGWKPDFKIPDSKCSIYFYDDKLDKNNLVHQNNILSFQSEEIRDKFYNNFKDLIEKTKPLFM